MPRGEFFTYALVVLVLILSGLHQFRSSRPVGIVNIVIACLIALEVSVKLDWIHLPNVSP